MLDCLKLLHFHMGSQISSILAIKEAMREASHTYCELARMGAPMVTFCITDPTFFSMNRTVFLLQWIIDL